MNLFIIVQVKETILKLVKQSDENTDVDFLDLLGPYRKRIVYEQQSVTPAEFDKACRMALAELMDDNN